MLTNAAISHYRSISEASISFGPVNIIVGPNGSGKSNLLDALYLVRDAVVDDIDTAIIKRHGIDSIKQWSKFRPYNIILDLRFREKQEHGSYKLVLSSSKGTFRILEESGSWYGPHPLANRRVVSERAISTFKRTDDNRITVVHNFDSTIPERQLRLSAEELFLTSINRGYAGFPYSIFQPIVREVSSFSKYNIYPNTLRNPQIVTRDNRLAEDGSNLASVLKLINGNKRLAESKEDIISGMRSIMPNVDDLLVKSAGGFYVPVLRMREENADIHEFNLSQISDGSLRTLGLLTAFYQPSAPLKIGVEEPEQMIHPGALAIIKEAMSAYVDSNQSRQLFVTTHSPTLLDLFEPDQIVWARFRNGVTQCGHIKERQLGMIKRQLFTIGELLLAEGIY